MCDQRIALSRAAFVCSFVLYQGRYIWKLSVKFGESFLQAFWRFSSRRSLPHHMISDNASTFLASWETLNDLFQSPSLKEQFSRQGVEWKFIPKRAPWYGGFCERLIGLTKSAIKTTLGKASITLTELQTFATEVEALLNDRPITYVSSNCVEEEPF